MTMHRRQGLPQGSFIVAALAGLLTVATATAQPAAPAATGAGISYINGGVGQEEAARMREIGTEFPVRLTFTRHNGTQNTDEFVADVTVRVRDSAGRTVVAAAAQGPIFLLRVPDGSYALEAERNGEVKTRRIDVIGDRHQEIAFSWSG